MEKLLGFMPDAEPTQPGVITDCTNFIPYEQGMKGAPSASTPLGVPALAAACIGAACVTRLDGTRRIFAGTSTKLYELLSAAWDDQSRVGDYAGGVDTRFSFAQFGNSTLASNGVEAIQRSTTGAFADIATAPKAKIIFSVGAFVMALNVNDGASKPDGWHCCASFDETDWATSVSTQATSGRLVSTPGEILAGGRLGEYAVAYKDKAVYLGQYVGAPVVWDWTQVPGGEAGCVGQDAWCDIGGAHFFIGADNFWVFDGSRPSPVGVGQVRQWFYDNSSAAYRYKTQCVFDRQNNVVWIFYCSTSSSTIDTALVFHLQTKQWGRATQAIEASLYYTSASLAIDDLPSVSATIDGLAAYSFDSQFWLGGSRTLSIFNTSHQLQSLTGASVSSAFTTGDAGDDEVVTLLSKIRPRFAPGYAPTTATVTTYTKMNEGDALTTVGTVSISNGKFDMLQSARWHRAAFAFTGDVRLLALAPVLEAEGGE